MKSNIELNNLHALLITHGTDFENGKGFFVKVTSKRFKKSFYLTDLSDLGTNDFYLDICQRLNYLGFNLLHRAEFGDNQTLILTDTFNMPETFTLRFVGRKIGSVGKVYNQKARVKAATIDAAKLMIYENFEHVSFNAVI